MMSSLVPGNLFHTPGLNRNSTPTPATYTPDQLDRLYGRDGFDGRPWPYDSPVHNVYDVKNTSTKLIILNNKYGQGHTRLRGYYTGPSSRRNGRHIDPERHSRVNSPRNASHHQRCLDSSSPYFEPDIKTDLEWVNQKERPPHSLTDGDEDKTDTQRRLDKARSAVNYKRHLHCQIPSSTTYYTDTAGDQSPRPMSRISRTSIPPRRFFQENADLTLGEKIYLWSIEKIYNLEHLKRLKQEQYKKLLELEAKKGQNISWKDYDKYMRYIQSANTRYYGAKSPGSFRARSAHSARSESGRTSPSKTNKSQDDSESMARPKTSESRPRSRKEDKRTKGENERKRKDDKSEESQRESEKTVSKSEETTEQTVSKTDDEKVAKTSSKRPISRTSQGQRPKSSASKTSAKSPSPYANPSPYSSRTTSAKSFRSSRPSSHRSNKSKPGSARSIGKESSKGDSSELRHKEGVDRPKSRLGHPSPRDKGSYQLYDQTKEGYSSDSDFDDNLTSKSTEHTAMKQVTDTTSRKSTDEEKRSQQGVKIHRVPSGSHIDDHDDSFITEPSKFESYQGEFKTLASDSTEATDKETDKRLSDTHKITVNENTNESGDAEVNIEQRGILPARSLDSDDEDIDRGPNKDLDKIEY